MRSRNNFALHRYMDGLQAPGPAVVLSSHFKRHHDHRSTISKLDNCSQISIDGKQTMLTLFQDSRVRDKVGGG